MANDTTRAGRRGRRDQAPTRHDTVSGSGSNQPKHAERKEQAGWVSRQGGDQTRTAQSERPSREQDDER